jgi:thiol:disulfide interchange protein
MATQDVACQARIRECIPAPRAAKISRMTTSPTSLAARVRGWLLALACCGFSVLAQAQVLPTKFDPSRDAASDVRTAVDKARAQRKQVLVDVGGEWCIWCHILDRFIASHAPVKRLLEDNYVVVKVNWSPQNRNETLLSQWPRIKGYPHLFVLDDKGQLVHSQDTSELEAGRDYDEGKVLAFLRGHSRSK